MLAALLSQPKGLRNLRRICDSQVMYGLTGKLSQEISVTCHAGPFELVINDEFVFPSTDDGEYHFIDGYFTKEVTSLQFKSESGIGFVSIPLDMGTVICGEEEWKIINKWRNANRWHQLLLSYAIGSVSCAATLVLMMILRFLFFPG